MPKTATPDHSAPSTFATRQAARAARDAAGEAPPQRRPTTFRAGVNEPTPDFVISHVRP